MMDSRLPAFRVPITMLLLVLIFLPTLVFYSGASSSLALGASVAALVIASMAAAFPLGLARPLTLAIQWLFGIALVIILHLLVAWLIRPVDMQRALGSFAPLLLIVLGGVSLARVMRASPMRQVDTAIRISFWALIFVSLLPTIGLDVAQIYASSGNYDKPVFPFTEPSHLVLILMPFYLYMCVSAPSRRQILLLGLGLVLVVALESLVLAAGWLMVALICMRGIIQPLVVFLMLLLFLTQQNLNYYLERLDLFGDTQNLSKFVYLQGWQLMEEALRRTNGWGYGFQQLGLLGTDVPISAVIFALTGSDANLRDGSFLGAKIVSEFGLLGCALVMLLLVAIVLSALELRRVAHNPANWDPKMVFMHAVYVGSFVELALRSTGYFSPITLLLVMATQLRVGQYRRKEVHRPKAE